MIRHCLYVFLAISTSFTVASTAWSEEGNLRHGPMIRDLKKDEAAPSITQIMVTLKPHARTYSYRSYDWGDGKTDERYEEAMSENEVQTLSKAAGIELKLAPMPEKARIRRENAPISAQEIRRINKIVGGKLINGFHSLMLPYAMTPKEAQAIAARLNKHPDVESADPDLPVYGHRVPNDTLYQSLQWNMQQSIGGVNLPPAWDTNTGGTNVVIAVLDSGILSNHTDIIGRTVAGYDFIADAVFANDGGGRDADPTDSGDFVTQADVTNYPTKFAGCIQSGQTMRSSDWHGTHVAGIIGANSNNGIGVAGVNWISKILPIRVLGKCLRAGSSSDIVDAVQWAAGISFLGTPPVNTTPAKIINMSLGGSGPCPPTMQSAINAAFKKNVAIVVSAGNNGLSALDYWPANCANVITVGAVNRQGGQSNFSNFGSALSLSAPGGANTGFAIDSIKSTGDGGTTSAANNNAYTEFYGTSQAAPHVAGVASLMFSARKKLTFKQVRTMLQKTARVFPIGMGSDCTTTLCGAGILDAAGAVAAAQSGVSGGTYHSAALQANGSVVAWGYHGNGQLGDGSALGTIRSYPGPVTGMGSGVIDFASGTFHNTALKSDGTVWGWGYNAYGQLGNNTIADQTAPVQVTTLTSVVAIVAGYAHTLALKSDGTVWSWGYNFFGQLGDGTFVDKRTPVQVSGLTGVVALAAGGKRSMALKNDGTVWMWGDVSNVAGGGGTASVSNVPLQMAGIADVIAIAAGGDATSGTNVDVSLALKFDGSVWAWGYNAWGQLGNGTVSTSFLPVQVTGLTDMVTIATGGYHSQAVKSDGTVWAWGLNSDGELGDGTNIYKTTPVQTVGLSKAVALATGTYHSMALNADLTIQEWGANNGGQLGNGNTTAQNTPVATHGQGNVGTYNTGNATTSQADLTVSLGATPSPGQTGSPLTYSFSATNLGAGAASNTVVTLALAGSATFVSASPACTQASGTVVCNLGTMNSGASTGLQVVVNPSAAGSISATAYVSSDVVDPNGANNSAAVSTTVNAPVVVAIDGDVPTLPEWGVILMGSLLLANMAWMERRKYRS